MILIFDLDDTLYDEMSFVNSGLKAVADFGYDSYGWNSKESLLNMQKILEKKGRGRIFDEWLSLNKAYSRKLVNKCINLYRYHNPNISPYPNVHKFLQQHSKKYPLYLVTDGNKNVQSHKIKALKIENYFQKIFITHRYGIENAKPSLYCFEMIRRKEACSWADLVYIGDNPAKDFVNLNKIGALTVRVKTGSYSEIIPPLGYEARHTINNILEFPNLLGNIIDI